MKILVVEDQPAELKLAVHVLSAAGYEVDRAIAADQALAAIKEARPSVILLDLSLPGMDGLTLARKLKADPETRGILIVAITSYPEKFSSADALEAGCDAYLQKPVSTRTLPETLAAVVESAGGNTAL
jgi:CheY-like chemotaxis protein